MERGGSRQLLRLRPGWRGAAGGSGAGRRRCIPRAGRGRFTPSVIVGWLRRGAPGRGSGAAGAGGWSPVGRSIVGVFCTKDCNQWGLWGRACVGLSAGWAVGLGLRPSPAAGPRVALCGPPGRREGSEVALRLWSRCAFGHEWRERWERACEVARGWRAGPLAVTRHGRFIGYSLHSYT